MNGSRSRGLEPVRNFTELAPRNLLFAEIPARNTYLIQITGLPLLTKRLE